MGNELINTFEAIGSLLTSIFTLQIVGMSIVAGLIMGIIFYFYLKADLKKPSPTIDDVFIKFKCPDCGKHKEVTVYYLVRNDIERPINCTCIDGNSSFEVVDTYIKR